MDEIGETSLEEEPEPFKVPNDIDPGFVFENYDEEIYKEMIKNGTLIDEEEVKPETKDISKLSLYEQGMHHYDETDFEKAIELWNEAIKLNSTDTRIYDDRFTAYYML